MISNWRNFMLFTDYHFHFSHQQHFHLLLGGSDMTGNLKSMDVSVPFVIPAENTDSLLVNLIWSTHKAGAVTDSFYYGNLYPISYFLNMHQSFEAETLWTDMWPLHCVLVLCIKEYKIRFVGRQPWEPDYEPDVWIWGRSEIEVHCPDVRTVHWSVQLAAAGPLSQRASPGQYGGMYRLSRVSVCTWFWHLVCLQVMHGGLFSRDDVTLDEISKIDRNRQPPEEGEHQHYR